MRTVDARSFRSHEDLMVCDTQLYVILFDQWSRISSSCAEEQELDDSVSHVPGFPNDSFGGKALVSRMYKLVRSSSQPRKGT